MKFDSKTINLLADKLLIGLSKDEEQFIVEEFNLIDTNMKLIANIENISTVEPMTHPFKLSDVKLREDNPIESIDFNDAFSNTDDLDSFEVRIPKTLD